MNPGRIQIVSFEDMNLITDNGWHNVILKAGVPSEVSESVFGKLIDKTAGVKRVEATVTPLVQETKVISAPETAIEATESLDILLEAACKRLILKGRVRRDFTPTGRLRVASVRELVKCNFNTHQVNKAQVAAEEQLRLDKLQVIANGDNNDS